MPHIDVPTAQMDYLVGPSHTNQSNNWASGLGMRGYPESVVLGLQIANKNISSAVALGSDAGNIGRFVATGSVAMGTQTGQNQGKNCIAIGYHAAGKDHEAGPVTPPDICIAIGCDAGNSYQESGSIAIGTTAAEMDQGIDCIAIGSGAGKGNILTGDGQTGYGIAIGKEAGKVGQGAYCIAIGASAGTSYQADYSIAIGQNAVASQKGSICIGTNASDIYPRDIVIRGDNGVKDTNTTQLRVQGSKPIIGPPRGVMDTRYAFQNWEDPKNPDDKSYYLSTVIEADTDNLPIINLVPAILPPPLNKAAITSLKFKYKQAAKYNKTLKARINKIEMFLQR